MSSRREPMSLSAAEMIPTDVMGGNHPVLGLPLAAVMKPEIALTLQHLLQIYTVGSFLTAWRNPKNHRSIEQVFDSPQQARNAVAVCATWLGVQTGPAHATTGGWWSHEDATPIDA